VPWWQRWALTPRAAVVLAAVVVVVALVVVALGAVRSRSSAEVTVAGGRPVASGVPSSTSVPPSVPSVAPSASSARVAVLAVHVLGAVAHAGVVEVPEGTRVDTVLQRAGGASADADLARLNLARPVVDGERLYVPRVGETEVPEALGPDTPGVTGSGAASGPVPGSGTAGGGVPASDAVVDLNTADQAALETLPGIGPALAARILSWREEHGGFSSVEDLLEVSGIGDGRFAELRDRVRV